MGSIRTAGQRMRPKSSKSSIEEETDSVSEKTTEDSCRATLLSLTAFSACLGFILFVTGCIITSYYNAFIDFITGRYTEGSIFLIIIGLLVISVSGLGFYAAIRSDYILMAIFLTIMVFCVISEIIGSITMFALNKDWTQEMATRERLLKSLQNYSGKDEAEMKVWDLMQTDLQCCGVNNYTDYHSSILFLDKQELPRSCCGPLKLDKIGNIEKCSNNTSSLHQTSCKAAISQYLSSKIGILGGVAATIGLLQISIISASAYLVRKWKVPGRCYPCY